MAWDEFKKKAVDPDNPADDEQVTADEWNSMTDYLKDKILGRAVNPAAIADKRIMVYDFTSDTFIFEDQSITTTLHELSDVEISGVPADNEVLAYDATTAKMINQTPAEAGLMVSADLAAYLPLTGGTMAGAIDLAGNLIDNTALIRADQAAGVGVQTNAGMLSIILASGANAFTAYAVANMNGYVISGVGTPTVDQDAAPKVYADDNLFGKELEKTPSDFTDGKTPVYRTGSGRFEMELTGMGGTLTSDLNADNHEISGIGVLKAYSDIGINIRRDSGAMAVAVGLTVFSNTYALYLYDKIGMNTYKIVNLGDPIDAQDAATKAYADGYIAGTKVNIDLQDGHIPVYRTGSGMFEMEQQSTGLGLPVTDSTAIVKGSIDGTKQVRFEIDGLATGTTRVLNIQDKDITVCGRAETMLLNGSQAMAGDLAMAGNSLLGCPVIKSNNDSTQLYMLGSDAIGASIVLYGENSASYPGDIRMFVPDAGKFTWVTGLIIDGVSDHPKVTIPHKLDLNFKPISNMLSATATALSGTPRDIEIDLGGVPYHFTVYPTKA